MFGHIREEKGLTDKWEVTIHWIVASEMRNAFGTPISERFVEGSYFFDFKEI